MCNLFGPDPPDPPNPLATAAAQTGTNVNTAIANAYLNSTNQVTPTGSLTYDQTGTFNYTDPTSGSVYQIPRFTATQKLSGPQQELQNTTEKSKIALAQLGANQSAYMRDYLGTGFDPTKSAPAAGDPNSLDVGDPTSTFGDAGSQQTNLGPYGQQQGTFGAAGDVTRNYGPTDNFSADRQRVEQSMFDRINPQLDRQRAGIEQHLADQGIRYGSQAYTSAMDDWNRQSNDARLGIVAQGGQEQQRLADMAAKQAGFQNSAQQQAYEQAQGRGTFANTAQAQQFQEQLGAANFGNAAQAQQFQEQSARSAFSNQALAQQMAQRQNALSARNSARAQSLQEQYAQRGQPINEISALLSQSQVSQPQFTQTPTTTIPTTDVAGLINQNFSQNFQNYQTQQQAQNQLLGGILGGGSNILASYFKPPSDRRIKKDIHRVGTVFAAEPQPVEEPKKKELPIYQFSYKDDPSSKRYTGPMAQDVEKIDPSAVENNRGVKHIDTRKVMGSILRAA